MAEKGFGVKEINLIGPSGTPTIESPNNLNLNAINVAISTNVSIGGTLTVSGNVSVGGTLTYEDVTNVDSVGLITARSGIHINNDAIPGIGITINKSGINVSSGIITAPSFRAPYNGGFSMIQGQYNNGYYINSTGGSTLIGMAYYSNNTIGITGNGSSLIPFKIDDVSQITLSPNTGNVALAYAGSTKLSTTSTGVNVTGAITVNNSALSIDPTNSDIQVAYTVTANGSSAYRFAGNGVVSTADNPDLYLIRGQKYRFINNSGGSHPFQIREASGGTAYSTGVTNNGAASGNIDFAPTYDSPAQLVYQCTSHGGMVGNIYLRGAAGNENNVGVTTSTNGLLVHREVNADISGGSSYDFTLPANCYKVDFVGHNIRMSASGTPSFQVGTTAGMITSGGKYNYTETAYGGNNQGRYQSGDNEIRFGYYNLNASSDTGEVFATFESSSAANMWVFNIDAHRRTQAGYLKAAGALDLSGNNLTTIRFYGWAGVNFASGRISWTAYCTS